MAQDSESGTGQTAQDPFGDSLVAEHPAGQAHGPHPGFRGALLDRPHPGLSELVVKQGREILPGLKTRADQNDRQAQTLMALFGRLGDSLQVRMA